MPATTGPLGGTSVLDNFNRANENPLAGGWAGPMGAGDDQLRIVSNQIAPPPTGLELGNSYWNTSFAEDQEVFMEIANATAGVFWIVYGRIQSPNSAGLDAYRAQIHSNVSGDAWDAEIGKVVNNSYTSLLGSLTGFDFAPGTSLGMTMVGNEITAWHWDGTWTEMGSATDGAITGSGYIGALLYGGAARGDTFGGGEIVGGGESLHTGYQRIVGPRQFTLSAVDLYTVPTGMLARIRQVYVNNPTGSEIEFTLSVGTDAAGTRLLDQHAVAAGESYSGRRVTDHALVAGETIQGFADSASAVVVISAHLETL